ncbi:MAG: sulfatase, partial [Halobacteriaceae archaeon]
GPYGGPSAATPTLNALAERGVVFENCYSGAPWTPPSHATMFTGTYPSHHDVRAHDLTFPETGPWLPELLSAAGIRTQGVGSEPWLSRAQGFARGFDRFHDSSKVGENLRDVGHHRLNDFPALVRAGAGYAGQSLRERAGSGTGAAQFGVHLFREWARRAGAFTFTNISVAHGPYDPPQAFRERLGVTADPEKFNTEDAHKLRTGELDLADVDWERLRRLYQAGVAHADHLLGRALDGLPEDTWIIVTADHGELLGEHGGEMRHQFSLHDEVINVPLVVAHPSLEPGRRTDLVSHVDLLPTVRDVLEREGRAPPDPGELPGRSLLEPPATDRTVFAEYGPPATQVNALLNSVDGVSDETVAELYRSIRAAITPEYKLITYSDGSRELYRTGDESENLADETPDVVADLEARMADELGEPAEPDFENIDAYVREGVEDQLRELGYL